MTKGIASDTVLSCHLGTSHAGKPADALIEEPEHLRSMSLDR